MQATVRGLDFIVIGVQKGGTTSLWQYLRHHPRIAMPDHKEAPIFCLDEARVPERLQRLMRSSFGDAAPEAMLGKVATYYMMGENAVDVDRVAERIARALPDVRLIALLRDPIERAMSHYRMSVRRGCENRFFDVVVEELMEPGRLAAGRTRPSETNSYLVQGEYGRILRSYRERFPAERIHVEATADLGREPGAVIDRVLVFLGLPPGYRPEGLGRRHHVGGTRPRLDPEAEAQLLAFVRENVWPHLGEDAQPAKDAFTSFLQTWNVIPDDAQPTLSAPNRRRLEVHYRADAQSLVELGIDAPWLAVWSEQPQP
jgi:Sulfotransferase domain